jgi:uncharacterized membrane protein
MLLARIAVLALVGAAVAGACGDHEPTIERTGGPEPEFDSPACVAQSCERASEDAADGGVSWCAAFDVIQRKCQPCHSDPPKNDAPISLMTFEDTQRCYNNRLVHDRMEVMVETGAMPFVELNDILHLDPPVEDLTEPERNLLLTWLREGACRAPGLECPATDAQ